MGDEKKGDGAREVGRQGRQMDIQQREPHAGVQKNWRRGRTKQTKGRFTEIQRGRASELMKEFPVKEEISPFSSADQILGLWAQLQYWQKGKTGANA